MHHDWCLGLMIYLVGHPHCGCPEAVSVQAVAVARLPCDANLDGGEGGMVAGRQGGKTAEMVSVAVLVQLLHLLHALATGYERGLRSGVRTSELGRPVRCEGCRAL